MNFGTRETIKSDDDVMIIFFFACTTYRKMTINTKATPLILRILCIHDNYSNAFDLKNEFHVLGKKLYDNHSIDLVYVNGPIIITTPDSTIDEKQIYVWWEEHNATSNKDSNGMNDMASRFDVREPCSTGEESGCPDDCVENPSSFSDGVVRHAAHLERSNHEIPSLQSTRYDGLDASLMLLRQIWTSCPFWGILGVGKGAAVASLFTTLLESEMLTYHAAADKLNTSAALPVLPIQPNLPQLIIFSSGESLLSVDEPVLVSNHFNTTLSAPSPFVLHLVDFDIPPEQELLIRQFSQGNQVERREKFRSSRNAFSQHDLNVIGRFICQRKKGLCGSYNDDVEFQDHTNQQNKILVFQTALYNAEQDAAHCIAETIALNPPAALMAVIRPQMVAGWKGNDRPRPEGGGAPCPEEFLHRKSQTARHS